MYSVHDLEMTRNMMISSVIQIFRGYHNEDDDNTNIDVSLIITKTIIINNDDNTNDIDVNGNCRIN